MQFTDKTICAISSPAGVGAISIIRLSGNESFLIVESILLNPAKFKAAEAGKMLFRRIKNLNNEILDEVLIVKFVAPQSFTGENMVEIYCHGSEYIQKEILNLLIENGAKIASPGEFTKRAFLNGKMDLSQSEAVADIISSNSSESHRLAMNQMKGEVSSEINNLRTKMIDLLALMELELDFGEEDVEFADRSVITGIISLMLTKIDGLINSFKYGNAIKNGVPVAIIGEPNVGKSTLLNALLKEDRAIVSAIPGTTRDTIEEELIIDGIKFRIIDTAGIRESEDEIEEIGIKRTYDKITKAKVVVLMIEAKTSVIQRNAIVNSISKNLTEEQFLIIAINKIDDVLDYDLESKFYDFIQVNISAKERKNIDALCDSLVLIVRSLNSESNDVIISSARHLVSLKSAQESLIRGQESINSGISGDFVSQDLREAMHYLGEITGQINTEEVLGAIFARFCIGK
jgi:tRNA modification GTPase